MRAVVDFPKQRRFSSASPENLLVIENYPERVIIRAGRNNFSAEQKDLLIRYLAAEGYIPLHFRAITRPDSGFFSSIDWIIDYSLAIPQPSQRKGLPRILLLIFCACLVWSGLMALAVSSAHRAVKPGQHMVNPGSLESEPHNSHHR